jgi:hypothetical protein
VQQRRAKIDLAGYDAGKKIKGKKRQTAVDTIGLLINIVVTPRRRAGSPHHRAAFGNSAPTLSITQERIADGGTPGKLTADKVRQQAGIPLDIVKSLRCRQGFVHISQALDS